MTNTNKRDKIIIAAAGCQMADFPEPIDLDKVVEATGGETSVAGVAAVAEAMGLPMTPPQH